MSRFQETSSVVYTRVVGCPVVLRAGVLALFVSWPAGAFAQAQSEGSPPPIDLRHLFTVGYMLEDQNGDDVVDFVNARIVLPSNPNEAEVVAAANVAARLGYETSALDLGMADIGSDGTGPFDVPVVLIGIGTGYTSGNRGIPVSDPTAQLAPGQGAITFVPEDAEYKKGGIRISGNDATGLLAAADYASGRYPNVWGLEGESYEDIADKLTAFLVDHDAQNAVLTLDGIVVDATRRGVSRLEATVRISDSESLARVLEAIHPKNSIEADSGSVTTPVGSEDRVELSDLEFPDLHRIDLHVVAPNFSRTFRLLPDEPRDTRAGRAWSPGAMSDFTLSDLYSIEGLYRDTNQDLVPDQVDAYVSLHGADTPGGAVDLAARIGLESAGIRLPLVRPAGQDDYPEALGLPILYGLGHYQTERLREQGKLYAGSGDRGEGFIEMVPEAFEDKHGLVISATDADGLDAISSYVSGRLPYLWEHGKGNYRLEDVETEVRRFFQAFDGPGQLSLAGQKLSNWLDRIEGEVESIELEIAAEAVPEGYGAYIEELINDYFPQAESSVATYETGFGVGKTIFEQDLIFPWEVDTFRNVFLADVLPQIGVESSGKIVVRLSEPPEVRQALEEEIEREVRSQGASPGAFDIIVLSAYKQGYSWLYDVVLPQIREMNVSSVDITYHTLKDSEEVRWQTVASDTRWLQELYPIDAVLAQELGVPDSRITFTPRLSDDPIYTVTAKDPSGTILMTSSFTPKYVVRPFFDLFPEYEQVRVTTGWVSAEVDGQSVLDRRIKTDPETFWDILQTDTYRKIVDYVMDVQQGRPSSDNAPYFDEFRIELGMSEPNYRIGVDEEVISSLEALHEDLYFETLTLFNLIGGRYGAGSMNFAGRVLPFIDPSGTGAPGWASISFTGKERAIPELKMTVRRSGSEPQTRRYPLSALPVETPKLRAVAVKAGEDGLSRLLFEVVANDSIDRYDEFQARSTEAIIDRTFLSVEMLSGMVDVLRELHERGMLEEALSFNRVDELGFLFTLEDSTSFSMAASIENSLRPTSTDNPVLFNEDFRYRGEPIVQWHTPISPAENDELLAKLNTFPSVNVYYMTSSFLGQNVYAVDFLPPMAAKLVSQAKLNALKPTLFISGRQHANEVSSTSHILRLAELLATDSSYAALLDKVNVVLHPITNPDGARLAVEMQEINPDFMLHAGYLGALGVDATSGQNSEDPIYPESKVRPRIRETWLPDIFINMHGYPTHEWVQYFAGYSAWVRNRNGGQRSWWSPRGWFIPGFRWVDDDEHEDIQTAQFAILDSVAAAITGESSVDEMNQRLYARYRKYGAQDVDNFREYFHNGILVSLALTGSDVGEGGVQSPLITYFSTTTEAPDETARGDWLSLVASAGLAHSSALLRYLATGTNRIERESSEYDGFVTRSVFRKKPVLPRKDGG